MSLSVRPKSSVAPDITLKRVHGAGRGRYLILSVVLRVWLTQSFGQARAKHLSQVCQDVPERRQKSTNQRRSRGRVARLQRSASSTVSMN